MPTIDPQFLLEEYKLLQATVEKFDEKSLTIKTWSVTLSMAGIGVGFLESEPSIVLLSAASAFLFWIIEVLWKSFQQAFYSRLKQIEEFMKNPERFPDFSSPYVLKSWSIAWRRTNYLRIMFWPHVSLPHLFILLVGVAIWSLNLIFGWPEI